MELREQHGSTRRSIQLKIAKSEIVTYEMEEEYVRKRDGKLVNAKHDKKTSYVNRKRKMAVAFTRNSPNNLFGQESIPEN